MSIKTRILGRDVQIRIAHNGVPFATITAIKNFTFEVRQRILTEQYQGEVANRQDSIFDEVGGSFTIHPEGKEAFQFQKLLADKAIRRTASEEQITMVFRATFPDGSNVRVTIPEAEFDPVPMNSSNRDAYVDMGFTYKAEKYSLET
jgi:hypothetical protein